MGIDFGQARNTTAWHPEPSFRGTYGLLSSCIVTMVLCIWTAIHVNIPELEREKTPRFLVPRQTWRKIGFLVVGLFAPELISWAAFEQRRDARALHSRMIKYLADKYEDGEAMMQDGEEVEGGEGGGLLRPRHREADIEAQQMATKHNKHKKRRHPWTMTHSHYAVMGGFAFRTQSPRGDFSPNGWRRVTLTSDGISHLAQRFPELVPDIPLAYINDKSKANALSKTIVILQALWFAAQSLSRMAMGMTLSLLELNTFAHAICALFAYIMWWNKPFDASEPTIIDGSGSDLVCASMCASSRVGKRVRIFDCSPGTGKKCYTYLTYSGPQQASEATPPIEPDAASRRQNSSIPWPSPPSGFYRMLQSPKPDGQLSSDDMVSTATARDHPDQTIFRLYVEQSLLGFRIPESYHYRWAPSIFDRKIWQATGPRPFVEIPPTHVLCFRLAAEARLIDSSLELVSTRRSNTPFSDESCIAISGNSMCLSLLISSLAYGGLHLLAWSPPVKTNAETVLWRVSGIGIATYPLVFVPFLAFIKFLNSFPPLYLSWKWQRRYGFMVAWANKKVDDRDSVFALGVVLVFHVIWAFLYALARICLVVECFISVPSLPDSVFAAPAWAQYFPHFG